MGAETNEDTLDDLQKLAAAATYDVEVLAFLNVIFDWNEQIAESDYRIKRRAYFMAHDR